MMGGDGKIAVATKIDDTQPSKTPEEALERLRRKMTDNPPRCIHCDQSLREIEHKNKRLSWECFNPECEFCYAKKTVQLVEAEPVPDETKKKRGRPLKVASGGESAKVSTALPTHLELPGIPQRHPCPREGCDGEVAYRITSDTGDIKIGCTNYYPKKGKSPCKFYASVGLPTVPELLERKKALAEARKKTGAALCVPAPCLCCGGEILDMQMLKNSAEEVFLLFVCENSVVLDGNCEVIFQQIKPIFPEKKKLKKGKKKRKKR
jgi:hypothetical protein